jgi:hypothetical protein
MGSDAAPPGGLVVREHPTEISPNSRPQAKWRSKTESKFEPERRMSSLDERRTVSIEYRCRRHLLSHRRDSAEFVQPARRPDHVGIGRENRPSGGDAGGSKSRSSIGRA